jgi:Transposase and inactivated derivatives
MKLQSQEAQEFRLQQIVSLNHEGYTQPDIARLLSCSQAWVCKVLQRAQREGPENLKAKGPAPGKTAALSTSQLDQLRRLLAAEAQAAGFASDGWTRQRVAHLIKQQFGVSHHLSHISRILSNLGFTLQKPKRRDYRQNAETVAQWQQETLPQLKKSAS